MTPEFWAILGSTLVIVTVIGDAGRRIEKKLDIIIQELAFQNQDKREIEKRERYPNLPY